MPSTSADTFALPILLLALALYFVPFIVASKRRKRNVVAIFWLNFFLGWTVVGWVIALVWATTVDATA